MDTGYFDGRGVQALSFIHISVLDSFGVGILFLQVGPFPQISQEVNFGPSFIFIDDIAMAFLPSSLNLFFN